MSRILMAGLACAAALCGCVAGIEASGKYPERTFAVAAVYARTCHEQSQRAVGVTFVAERHPDAKSLGGEVKVRRDDLPGKYFEIIAVRHDGKGDSLVTVTVLGEKEWDEAELDAAERSIATATPVCRQVAR